MNNGRLVLDGNSANDAHKAGMAERTTQILCGAVDHMPVRQFWKFPEIIHRNSVAYVKIPECGFDFNKSIIVSKEFVNSMNLNVSVIGNT